MLQGVRGYVLAGGESSRMQRLGLPADKASLIWRGSTLLHRSMSALLEICEEVRVLCGTCERCTHLGVSDFGVPDQTPSAGPLGGLEAALMDASTAGCTWVLLLPVDLPWITSRILYVFGEQALVSGSAAACMKAEQVAQPLPALVSTRALSVVQQQLDAGERRLLPALSNIAQMLSPDRGLCVLAAETLTDTEDSSRWFWNVNTPEDFNALG